MINPFGMANDIMQEDELSVSIYSDVLDSIFTCSTFRVKKRALIDFKGLTVPCNEVVLITLTEKDIVFNDGHTVMVSCREMSTQTVDITIPSGSIQESLDSIQSVLKPTNKVLTVASSVSAFTMPTITPFLATISTVSGGV